MSPRPHTHRPWAIRLLAALGFYAALTVFMTWPLSAHLGDAIAGESGDGQYFMWLTGWYPEAILRLGVSPLWVPWLNYPEGYALAYNEMTPGTALFAWPLTLLGGATLGYNFVVLSSMILAGTAAYLWAFRFTRSHSAALIGGMVFTFMTDHVSRAGVHVTLVCTQWLAFYLLSLQSALSARAPRTGTAIAAGVFLALLALSGQYLFYHALVLSVLYVAGYLIWINRTAWKTTRLWTQLARIGLFALPFIAAAEIPYVQLTFTGNGPAARPIGEVQLHGASLTDFLSPVPSLLLRRYALGGLFDAVAGAPFHEHTIYLGSVAIGLACIAIGARRRTAPDSKTIHLWTFMGVCTVILAMGVSLNAGRQTVLVDLPEWLRPWYPYSQTFVPLPGFVLYKLLPFYSSMRVWTRWAFSSSLFVSLLAAAGATALLARAQKRVRLLLAVALCALVLIDSSLGFLPLTPTAGRPVDYWLAQQPGNGAIVQLPVNQSLMYAHLVYYATIAGKPYVGSNFGAFWSPQAKRLVSTLADFPTAQGITLLRELGVQWVVIDTGTFPQFEESRAALAAWEMRLRYESNGAAVYELGAR
ncbi:MAG: hypothetical protein HZB53_13020 [Chloroflexi bacterium]|nr:hypothetical protein [Chloroflexota bacterium]